MRKAKFNVGSLYAGVGGICLGFTKAGFKMQWANEIDKNACDTYRLNFSHDLYQEDVLKLDPRQLEPVDVLTAGFPCQPFSVAGYQKGFADTRGNHFFRILEYIDVLQPKVVFLENVKNLSSHDKGNTYKTIIKLLNEKGYKTFPKILNTKDYGNIPHNRERIFIVCLRNDIAENSEFNFPKKEKLTRTIQDVLSTEKVDEKYYYRDDKYMYETLLKTMNRKDTVYQWRRQYVRENKSNVCPTLTANMGTGGHNVPLVMTSHGIRKLTPTECFELQGFPVANGKFKLPPIANSHLYKQAGNSVSVSVIEKLALTITEILEKVEIEQPTLSVSY